MYFDWQPLPADPPVLIHLGLVALLMIVFPFSKLLHAPGVFFSPTRNQADNPREMRYATDTGRNVASGE
jgi:nitrate reductase gamma subunit